MRKKIIISVIVTIFLAFLSWRLYHLFTSKTKQKYSRGNRPPVAVEYAAVINGPIQEIKVLTGTVYPAYQYIIAPKVSGRLVDLRKRIGDPVQANEIVGLIDDAEYQQNLLEAEANLRIAESALAEARSTFELARQEKSRVETLFQKGIASPAELDAANTNYQAQQSRLKLAEAQIEQRKAALEAAKIRLDYTKLRASLPGLVGERYVDEGALLAVNNPVLLIVNIDKVIIKCTVIEKDYGKIKQGQAATITVYAFPNKNFVGKVTRIAPMLQEAARVAQLEIEVNNPQHELKPGMFVKASIITDAKNEALLVPTNALTVREGKTGIFTINDSSKTVNFVPVSIGISNNDYTEILSPHLKGNVVTLGQHLLENGSPVILTPKTSPEMIPEKKP